MSDRWNSIFQNGWYVGNNFNCILYGTYPLTPLT